MWLLLLMLVLVLLYPISFNHFFSPSHPDPLFLFAHSSPEHLTYNVISLFLVWLIAEKFDVDQLELLFIFFLSSFSALAISILFSLPVLGSSVGIYGMIGYLLPELSPAFPLWLSYFVMFLAVIAGGPYNAMPWEKLFHLFGLSFGLMVRYFSERPQFELLLSRTQEYYALEGWSYVPYGYDLLYSFKTFKK